VGFWSRYQKAHFKRNWICSWSF